MKKLELNQMENLDGGKFWGWTAWEPMGPCTNGMQSFVRHYNVLWINTGSIDPSGYDYDVRSC